MKRICIKALVSLCVVCAGCQGRQGEGGAEGGALSDSLVASRLPDDYRFCRYLGRGLCAVSSADSSASGREGVYSLSGRGLLLPLRYASVDSIAGGGQCLLLVDDGHTILWDAVREREVLDVDSLSLNDFYIDRYLALSAGVPVWVGYTSPYVHTVLLWGNGDYRFIQGEHDIRLEGGEVVMERGVETHRFPVERLKEGVDSLDRACADGMQWVARADTVRDRDAVCGTLCFRMAYPSASRAGCSSLRQWLGALALGMATGEYGEATAVTPFVRGEDLVAACMKAYTRYCHATVDGDCVGELYPRLSFSLVPRWQKEGLLTYFVATDSYGGGAHGMYTRAYVSFDTRADKRLSFDDIVRPEARQRVRLLLLAKIKEHFRESLPEGDDFTDADCLSRLMDVEAVERQFGSSASPEAVDYMKRHFLLHAPGLMPAGLVFAYAPYEIDSFAGGNKLFVIPYAELRGCLWPDIERLCIPE